MPRAAFTSAAALRWAVSTHEVSGQHWWKIWLSVCHHWEDCNYSSTWRVGALKKHHRIHHITVVGREGGVNSMFILLTVKDAGVCHFLPWLRHDNAPTIFFLKRETPRSCSLLPEGWRTFKATSAAHRLATASVQMPSSNTKNRRIIND